MKLKICQTCGVTNESAVIHKTKYNDKTYFLCSKHYQVLRVYGKFKSITEEKKERYCEICGISGQIAEVLKTKKFGDEINVCKRHYDRLLHGTEKLKDNEYVELEDCYEMTVFSKEGKRSWSTTFSKRHVAEIKKHKWHVSDNPLNSKTQYIINGGNVYLHRFIGEILFTTVEGYSIDHIDRNGLNNLDENLRLADAYIQMANQGLSVRNTSGVRGVSFSKTANRWRARIKVKDISKQEWCASFEEAVELRLKWEKERDEYLSI